jgi:lipopolysaccharide/colanic/teichoic acid biosynthesis glycosyltransferase
VLDIVLSLSLLLVTFPLFILVTLAIWLTSPGPVVFKQKRIGRGGKIFLCYKFRTMVPNAEELLRTRPDLRAQFLDSYKLKNDPRITRVGRVLRKTSLDELPQLINVLKGDISLIGPRPIVQAEIVKYGPSAGKLLSVTPGLSGLWQVSGRSDVSYEERVRMDMTYIDRRSLWLDTRLMFQTMVTVLKGRGAC